MWILFAVELKHEPDPHFLLFLCTFFTARMCFCCLATMATGVIYRTLHYKFLTVTVFSVLWRCCCTTTRCYCGGDRWRRGGFTTRQKEPPISQVGSVAFELLLFFFISNPNVFRHHVCVCVCT